MPYTVTRRVVVIRDCHRHLPLLHTRSYVQQMRPSVQAFAPPAISVRFDNRLPYHLPFRLIELALSRPHSRHSFLQSIAPVDEGITSKFQRLASRKFELPEWARNLQGATMLFAFRAIPMHLQDAAR
jgi:hypothetical protein